MTHLNPNLDQLRFRWRNDNGSETAATWIAAVNTDASSLAVDTNYRLRFEIIEDNGDPITPGGGDMQLQFRVDGGSWTNLTGSSSNVRASASTHFADAASTTQQLGSATFITPNGAMDEANGRAGSSIAYAGSDTCEYEWCFQFRSADLSPGTRTIDFQVTEGNGTALGSQTVADATATVSVPQPGLNLTKFRFRTDDSQTLNANAGWDAAADTSITHFIEHRFRLRFEITAAGTQTEGFTLQYARGGTWDSPSTSWAAVGSDSHMFGPTLATTSPVSAVPSDSFTDGASTSAVLGSPTGFVAGNGNHDATTATVALGALDRTEIEWCLRIRKLSHIGATPGGTPHHIADGDVVHFRVVRDDGTTDGWTYNVKPSFTVENRPGWIGGCTAEMGDHIWAKDSNDNLYAFVEYAESFNEIVCMKSTDDGVSWNPVDEANRPGANANADFEGGSVVYNPDAKEILVAHNNPNEQLRVHVFRPSDHATNPDTWGTVGDIVDTSTLDKYGSTESVAIRYRSAHSDYVILNNRFDSGSEGGVFVRDGVVGSWNTTVDVDTQASTNFAGAQLIPGEAGVLWATYCDRTNGTNGFVYAKSIASDATVTSGSLGTRVQVGDDSDVGTVNPAPNCPGYYFDDSGVERIVVGWHDDGAQHFATNIISDGTAGTVQNASDAATVEDPADHNGAWAKAIVGYDANQIALWIDSTTPQDLMRAERSGTSAWGTPVVWQDLNLESPNDQTSANPPGYGAGWSFIDAQVFTRGGGTYLGVVLGYAHAGQGCRYYEEELVAPPTGTFVPRVMMVT